MLYKYLTLLIFPFCGFSNCNSDDTNVIEICHERLLNRRLLLVSTLDGRLSALDIINGGSLRWSINTEPGPLLSSTIHQLELSENSHSVRIIPSLSGGLYKFDGDFIEPIPVNVDSLLKSHSDDVDITGGKEIRSYAVEIESGKVLYECSMNECSNWTENTYLNYDMMLVRRETQIVRAIEPQTRIERWNYSVGLHNVTITRSGLPECHMNQDPINFDVKVVVPKGLLSVVNKSEPDKVIWEHKFDSPVVNVWRLVGNRLENVDLFRSAESAPDEMKYQAPSLYIGMHNKQWYIQESEPFHKNHLPDKPLLTMKKWKLIHAVDSDSDRNLPQITDESGHNSTTALSMLYDLEAVNGEGYYLYCTDKKGDCHSERRGFFNMSIFAYWWKEAAVIFLVTMCLINYLMPCPNLTSFSMSESIKIFLSKFRHPNVTKESAMEATNSKQDSGIGGVYCKTSSEYETSQHSFKSRYLDDFEPIHCLGKGGFGVVFEARNKIDDCHYAIKRITLPNKEEARERVMREVKALAKLEHQHIVRYFQAWQECPPVGWQEEQDKLWKNKAKDDYLCSEPDECLSSELDGLTTSNTSTTSPSHANVFDQITNACELKLSNQVADDTSDKSNSVVEFRNSSQSENSDVKLKNDSGAKEPSNSSVTFYGLKRRKSLMKTSKVYLYIQMQLCQKNSLKEWLCSNLDRDTNTILGIFDQIVQAVEYVHLQGLIHRDLKPSNIFFSPDGQIKVGDFGLVTEMIEDVEFIGDNSKTSVFNESRTANVGTELYMSPEQVHGKPYNYKVDIYSLGIILFELLVPFSTEMERYKTLTNLRENQFPSDFCLKHENEFNLLSLMLANVPEKRPTTIGIRESPPLSNFRPSESSNLQDWHFELPTKNNINILRKSSAENA